MRINEWEKKNYNFFILWMWYCEFCLVIVWCVYMYYNFFNVFRNFYFIERVLGDVGELGILIKLLVDVKKVFVIMSWVFCNVL